MVDYGEKIGGRQVLRSQHSIQRFKRELAPAV